MVYNSGVCVEIFWFFSGVFFWKTVSMLRSFAKRMDTFRFWPHKMNAAPLHLKKPQQQIKLYKLCLKSPKQYNLLLFSKGSIHLQRRQFCLCIKIRGWSHMTASCWHICQTLNEQRTSTQPFPTCLQQSYCQFSSLSLCGEGDRVWKVQPSPLNRVNLPLIQCNILCQGLWIKLAVGC